MKHYFRGFFIGAVAGVVFVYLIVLIVAIFIPVN